MQLIKRSKPERQASKAGLRYVNDGEVGFRRQRHGKNFRYLKSKGDPLLDKAALERIRKLAIPPAWEDVWICAFGNGHLQATGRDARGRKQYRYHEDFRGHCERDKFSRLAGFALILPQIRAGVARDLALRGLPRLKVLAAIVSLLEVTLIRVGNDDYARQNGSYGISTMMDCHAKIDGNKVNFTFLGKSGRRWKVSLRDRRIAKIVKACQDLPGQRLFQYVDDDGNAQRVTSTDINTYLRDLSGSDITAKDFRTWSGTVMAAILLAQAEKASSKTAAKRIVRTALEQVAKRLGNTVAICRKCYVHPEIIERYESDSRALRLIAKEDNVLTAEEGVLRLLSHGRAKPARIMPNIEIVANVEVI